MQQSMFTPEEWVLSITQLNEYVRKTLAADPMLRRIKLQGEISNFKRHGSGHLYFSLKDAGARIGCVMFRQYAQQLGMRPGEGQRVVLSGQVSLYARDGQYQFYAEGMRPAGVGDLYQQFEALKEKLIVQGLFDVGRKRALPLLPRVVGVVTSPTGAAIQDIIRVARQRNPGVHILLYPARVQGEGAAGEIIAGIAALCCLPEVDVIIVGRGGGSLEDLWAFNEEALAHAIAASPVPVISAVGHETDTTISDWVCDVRAATPSAAAMLAVPDRKALQAELCALKTRLYEAMKDRLEEAVRTLEGQGDLLRAHTPERQIEAWSQRLLDGWRRLQAAIEARFLQAENKLLLNARQMRALDPHQVLTRGYAYIRQAEKIVPDANTARPGKAQVVWRDGEAEVDIVSIRKEVVANGTQEETEF